MCGIFALLNYNDYASKDYEKEFNKGSNRGPENSKLEVHKDKNFIFGFHRLAINGLNEKSNQPFHIKNCILICNGEIYNYKELYSELNIKGETDSDCEIIIHLYRKFGIEHTLTLLDGVFAFILFDKESKRIYVARDPLGVRPLYILKENDKKQSLIGFASELKSLHGFYNEDKFIINQFTPASYSVYEYLILRADNNWRPTKTINKNYMIFSHPLNYCQESMLNETSYVSMPNIYKNIRSLLFNAVYKRYLNTERPIACLLSGGLDSSLIAGLVSHIHKNKKNGNNIPIETYSIGLKDSEDIVYARKVAEHIKSKHTEIIVTEDEMFNQIPEVIAAIESYDVTTIRASLGNYLLGKYISKNSQAKVIFNGDGSDELCGGYLYMNHCPSSLEFDLESRRLLKDIHYFDVLRSDKCISSHGLEPRTPFLDKSFVNYYLSIPAAIRNHNVKGTIEKCLLRTAFSNTDIIPEEILWRKKEAFSDGVSNKGRSLFEILQEKVAIELNKEAHFECCYETEKYYYEKIYKNLYPYTTNTIPYYWMPKYICANDPSARTLKIYDKPINKEIVDDNIAVEQKVNEGYSYFGLENIKNIIGNNLWF